jgi:hypothetical protein
LNEKPSIEQWDMMRYFLSKLNIDEPFDQITWAQQIKHIQDTEGYSLDDIRFVIDWLSSSKGTWFKKNIPDAYMLRKHFKTMHEITWENSKNKRKEEKC